MEYLCRFSITIIPSQTFEMEVHIRWLVFSILLSTLSIQLEGYMNRNQACRHLCGGGTRGPASGGKITPGITKTGVKDGLSGRAYGNDRYLEPADYAYAGPGSDDRWNINGELNFNWDTQIGWNTTFYGNISGGREHESLINLDNGGYIRDKDWFYYGAGFESNPWIVTNIGIRGGIRFGNVGGRKRRRRRRDTSKQP
ncbi:unnamed protein product [Orchesella dallaii]|uniref:Uncharacterized protein n=1 Tax=Orchesella dallaii TaxID=48710 RepID=A0ABP1RMW4_9HEXA